MELICFFFLCNNITTQILIALSLEGGTSGDTIVGALPLHFYIVFLRIHMVTGQGREVVLPGSPLDVTGRRPLVGGAEGGGGISESGRPERGIL